MSRLDKFLQFNEWCLTWTNCFQMAVSCGLSYHCRIVLTIDEENRGPKPFLPAEVMYKFPRYKDLI